MRRFAFILFTFSFFGICSAQTKYDSIGVFDIYKSDWAMVENNGNLGFIDNKGKEVVEPIYDKIGFFDEYKPEWALVEINGKVGFIDNKGNYIEKK